MKEVEAVKTKQDIDRITFVLEEHGAIYSDIWKFGINTALRISDLLDIKFSDVTGERLILTESKTGKSREIALNAGARAVIEQRREANPEHIYLFQSVSNRSKSLNSPITRFAVARVFKEVGERKSVGVHLGTHSMRKTRGYAMHKAGVPLEEIMRMLNHSSTSETLRYIGITQEDVDARYEEFVL